jgi:hypothetical protein
MKSTSHEVPNINWGDWYVPNRSVSLLWLLRQVSSVLSRNRGNQAEPDLDGAWFATANFMAGKLHGLDYVNAGSELRGTYI